MLGGISLVITRVAAVLSVAALFACAAHSPARHNDTNSLRGVTLQLVGTDDQGFSFEIDNRSNTPFHYRHWTGGGTKPVLLIERIVDGKIERHDEWPADADDLLVTHEELVLPHERVRFNVPDDSLHRVGVMYWDDDLNEQVLWSQEVER